jgi:uncharacterized protein (DUF2062 family)
MPAQSPKSTVFQKISDRLLGFLQQGITPEKMALALAIGVTIGTMPLLGATTVLCTVLAFWLRLNMAFLQLVNYVVYPLQLLLYIPFLRMGAEFFSEQKFNYSLEEIMQLLSADAMGTIGKFFIVNLCGLFLWLILTPLLFGLSYFIARAAFRSMAKRFLNTENTGE